MATSSLPAPSDPVKSTWNVNTNAPVQSPFAQIAQVISQNLYLLQKPGVLFARPGYEEKDGYVNLTPAIVVTVANKRDVPANSELPVEIGGFPVDVRQATVLERIQAEDPGRYAQLVATGRPEYPPPAFADEYIVNSGALSATIFEDVLAARSAKPEEPYTPPENAPLDAVTAPMAILCHVSPDAGWQQLKRFFEQISSKLTVGMYDFTSEHILDELTARLKATAAELELILDDPAKNPTADQTDPETVSDLLTALGTNFKQAWALDRNSPKVNRWIFPSAYHIKVAVSDSRRFWLSSGNWNNSNQPAIDPWKDRTEADQIAKKSDRDWHVVVDHAGLAQLFEAYIQNDFSEATDPGTAPDAADLLMQQTQLTDVELQALAAEMLLGAKAPATYFEPVRVPAAGTESMTVQPLLTPDPGCYTGHVLALVRGAKKSFYMQTQYIHPSEQAADQKFNDLIEAVIELQKSDVDVRLIVSQWQKQKGWLDKLLATGIDPKALRIQTGVHNKGIVVDSEVAMVSSENWSGDGVLRNRDAGLIIHHADVARYYEQIFLHDWENMALPVSAQEPNAVRLDVTIPAVAMTTPAISFATRSVTHRESKKTRFVMANRRAGKIGTARQVSRFAIDRVFASIAPSVDLLADNNPENTSARRVVVFDADPAEVRAKVTDPNVLVEPEILHWTDVIPPPGLGGPIPMGAPPAMLGTSTARIDVTGNSQPLANATVMLYLIDESGSKMLRTLTDAQGHAELNVSVTATLSAYVVIPAGEYWTMVKRGPSLAETIDCPPLPANGPLGWWHDFLGITAFDPTLGQGIKVGVIDTGCGPHPFLSHVTDAGSFIDGAMIGPPDPKKDVDSHGSHVCGIIGARPSGNAYAGIAPGASLYCARVFPGAEQPANQGDIAKAIDTLSGNLGVDLINMSLGATAPSQIEHDSITDAYEGGTLCICAAGNDSSAVNWPAQFVECAAVSAIGVPGWGPAGSLAASRLPIAADRFGHGGYFLANFSSFGPQLLCAGSGVGIISTVPERYRLKAPYLAMDGTSMASPAVTGALAALLSKSPAYTALARNRSRAESARAILRQACQDLGLDLQYQGLGVPKV
jgi:subtilisin family serine protease